MPARSAARHVTDVDVLELAVAASSLGLLDDELRAALALSAPDGVPPPVAAAYTRFAMSSLRASQSALDLAIAAQRAALASSRFAVAAARIALVYASFGLALPLAAAPRFHADRLPGAPADATFVEVEGVHVCYHDAGAGPAVVLIHGFGSSSECWRHVVPALAAGHRVIAVDLKGFGWSSRPAGDYSPAAQAELVHRTLDALGVDDVAVVGHSWGSSVALEMAVQRPSRVRRIALYAAHCYDDQVPAIFRLAEKPLLGELLFALYYPAADESTAIQRRAAFAYFDESLVTPERVAKVEAELRRPGTIAAALASARRHHFHALHAALRTFDRPVLLLWGEHDQVTPLQFGHRLAAELANAELRVYPACGHLPMVEAHEVSTRDLVAFLAAESCGA
ncbi:MAG TPA: alpha/beta fold hydrolase [Kofleriaceae bacterium]|nr:alpha/beta fold hydrolase [Kofleriaceae bacterium]